LLFCLFFRQFVYRKFIRFCLFDFWINQMIVCCFEFEKKRNRSKKKDNVFWWKACHKKRCFKFLWNEQFEFFVIKQVLRQDDRNWRRERRKKTFRFRIFCYRLCLELLSRRRDRKSSKRRCVDEKESKISKN
jgi:hypothetical protein